MTNTKKLLSITNLKKYFPVAKTSIFQKKQLYVRANEDISIDIYEGETLGVVGESGCGKSTLGRVLLQLYPQTAGCTLYYGSTIDDVTPSYVKDTIIHADKYRRNTRKPLLRQKLLTIRLKRQAERIRQISIFFRARTLLIAMYRQQRATLLRFSEDSLPKMMQKARSCFLKCSKPTRSVTLF